MVDEKKEHQKTGLETGCFDNFSLDCFRDCPTYYLLRIDEGLIKPGAIKTAADFGAAMHSGLEHWYKKEMTNESMKRSMEILLEEFKDKEQPSDEKHTLSKGIEILGKYFLRYQPEPFSVIDTEVGGAVELGPYLYTFRIDLTLKWTSTNDIFGMDHKTTHSLNRILGKPNNQFTGYVFALSEHYENVGGFIVNIIGVFKDSEEMDKNAPKVVSPKTGKPIYSKKEKEIFQRIITSRSKSEIDAWKNETLHLITLIERCTKEGVWPKSSKFCTAYNSRCQYHDICVSQDRSIIQPMVDAGIYQRESWIPYRWSINDGEEGE